MYKRDISVVICCAGMGTRLGIGSTKALLDIDGKPLIIRQLEQLDECDDIRIVVGYQADKVIDVARSYRQDLMFVFNYQYETTGVGNSLYKGLLGARKYVIVMDGDVLVNPNDFKKFINHPDECICFSKSHSVNQIYLNINNEHIVHSFLCKRTYYEWSGIAKIETKKLIIEEKHVYQMLEKLLPMQGMQIRSRDIDTVDDYENALEWIKSGYED